MPFTDGPWPWECYLRIGLEPKNYLLGAVVYHFFELFSYLKEGNALRWNLHLFTRLRITPLIRTIRSVHKRPEPPDLNPIIPFQSIRHHIKNHIHYSLSLLVHQMSFLRNCIY